MTIPCQNRFRRADFDCSISDIRNLTPFWCRLVGLQLDSEKAVAVAVGVNPLDTVDFESGFRSTFRIELHKLNAHIGNRGKEG